jgi:adenylate cyclase
VPSEGFVANAPGLANRAGHITPRLDADGAVRRVPALICNDGRNYPTLALAGMLAAAQPTAPLRVLTEPGTRLTDPAWTLSFPGLPGVQAPLDAQGNLRVPYL